MRGPDNPAGESWDDDDPWVLVEAHVDKDTDEWETSWRRTEAEKPTRWLRSRAGPGASGIRVTGHGGEVFLYLPARVLSLEVVEDKTKDGRIWRTTFYEVAMDLLREVSGGGEPRVVADSVRIARAESTGVTTSALRFNLGELIDWSLTREPVTYRVEGSSYLGAGHPAAAEALRAGRRKTGKRGSVVSVEEVAAVARAAPPRGLDRALREAFPYVGRSTLMRVLQTARTADPSLHSKRSRRSSP